MMQSKKVVGAQKVRSVLDGTGIKHEQPKGPVKLWLQYNQTYLAINQMGPKARAQFASDPGYKWMRNGWWIFLGIVILLGTLGRAAQLGLWWPAAERQACHVPPGIPGIDIAKDMVLVLDDFNRHLSIESTSLCMINKLCTRPPPRFCGGGLV